MFARSRIHLAQGRRNRASLKGLIAIRLSRLCGLCLLFGQAPSRSLTLIPKPNSMNMFVFSCRRELNEEK